MVPDPGAHAPARAATYDVTQVVSQGWHHQSRPGRPPGPRSTGLKKSAGCSQKSHAGPLPAASIQPTLLVISPRQRLGGDGKLPEQAYNPRSKRSWRSKQPGPPRPPPGLGGVSGRDGKIDP